MLDPILIQEERRLLSEVRQAADQRAKTISSADTQFEQVNADNKAELTRELVKADTDLAAVRKQSAEAQDLIQKSGWARRLRTDSQLLTPYQPGVAPEEETARCLNQIQQALKELKARIGEAPYRRPPSAGKRIGCILFMALIAVALWIMYAFGYSLSYNYSTGSYVRSSLPSGWLTAAFVVGALTLVLIPKIIGPLLGKPKEQEQYDLLRQTVANAEYWIEASKKQRQQQYESQLDQARARWQQSRDKANQASQQNLTSLQPEFASVTKQASQMALPWTDPAWGRWTSGVGTQSPITRLGELQAGAQLGGISLPAILAFPGDRPFLIESSGPGKSTAVEMTQSLLLRLLATTPPGKLRCTFLDPVGLGQNVAPFMQLADYDDTLVTSRAWTEPQHIEQRLADLTEHMENVIQKYLRNQYKTIEQYNADAGEVAEPYRVLVVFDFPANFGEAAARRLVSIAQNGPRCGVYTVVLVDTAQPPPHGFNLADLERNATVIAWDKDHFVWQDEDFKDCRLELDTPPGPELFDRIVKAVGEAAKGASRVEVPFERIAPRPEQWWHGDSRTGLSIPLGPSGARKVQTLSLGAGTAQHVLIAGKTGSGKSTLLHTVITGLALTYSPEEVELYLIDFKKGVEFKTYAAHQLPQARVIAVESEREFGLSVLQGLDAELKRRGELFRGAGVDGIADYRQKTGRGLPRILLLVDEFQEFFTDDDPIASQAAQILDRLVRQGRAFGIHVLLGSQTLAGAYTLARSTIDQMAVRIALQCSEADSRLILADDNPAARLLSRPGEAIYNAANGTVEGNNRFQVALLTDEARDRFLSRLQEREYRPPQPQIVFEGNAPADVAKNRLLQDLLLAPPAAAPRVVLAWLGEPIAIKEPTAATFRAQSGNNLLLVGQNDEAALGMFVTALVSLAAQQPAANGSGPARFYVLDFTPADVDYADVLKRLPDLLPGPVRVAGRRGLPEVIAEVAAEVDRRLAADDATGPPIYLAIYGLQRARDLRPEEDFAFGSFDAEAPAPPNPAKQFPTILREGPELGVHTLAWCDTYTNLARTLDRRALREFDLRVVFQMSGEDSSNLIDTPAASKLGPYRAFFFSDEQGRLEKFRPYGLPADDWLQLAGAQLRAGRPVPAP